VVLDQLSFRRPVRFGLGIGFFDDVLALGRQAGSLIRPGCKNATWFEDAACLGKKSVEVKPVQSLCNCDQIDGIGVKAGILCGRDAKFYFRVRLRRRNLLLACICRQYLVEERRQRARRLTAAGGTVPCNVMPGAECRQTGEQ
jgi:hypothetical protein